MNAGINNKALIMLFFFCFFKDSVNAKESSTNNDRHAQNQSGSKADIDSKCSKGLNPCI